MTTAQNCLRTAREAPRNAKESFEMGHKKDPRWARDGPGGSLDAPSASIPVLGPSPVRTYPISSQDRGRFRPRSGAQVGPRIAHKLIPKCEQNGVEIPNRTNATDEPETKL